MGYSLVGSARFGPQEFPGDGDESFDFELVGTDDHVGHLLFFVGLVTHVSQDDEPLLFARLADMGAVAVMDARTGDTLRVLGETGLAGPTLRVP